MTDTPTLTVFMPVYNAEKYVGIAIQSVLDQTYSDFEFLIVDDGSTDGTAEVIGSFDDPRIRVIHQENQGCYPARNRAIAEARGEYLANMDADDLILPEKFEKQIKYLEEHPEVVLVATKTYECDMDDTVRLPRRDPDSYDSNSPITHCVDSEIAQVMAPFVPGTIMFRASLVEKMGPYDGRLCYCGDMDFIARAALEGKIACLPDIDYVIRLLPTSISSAGTMIQREITGMIAGAYERTKRGEPREFTRDEVRRLEELTEIRRKIPATSSSKKIAFYHTRLSTLHRMNAKPLGALKHAFIAASFSPMNLAKDRKLQSNILKSLAASIGLGAWVNY
ncbi:MAG: glycosyltransferase family 2 protein [Candidatus Omnitrophica bacterium]|nr:glycosyltransferase family 2 protein [Candidatus Omnitrophota bacterium]